MKRLAIVAAIGIAYAGAASAGEWSGSVEAGYLASQGNSKTSAANAAFAADLKLEKWTHSFKLGANTSSSSNTTTGERYTAGAKAARVISDFDYLYATADYDKDRFGGFDQRVSESVGYGRKLLSSETQSLTAEVGAGARQTELSTGERIDETIGRGNVAYRYVFSEGATFAQTLLVESGEESTFAESVTSLAMPLIKDVSVKLSYTVKHNSVVPAGSKHSDSYTAVNVGYSF